MTFGNKTIYAESSFKNIKLLQKKTFPNDNTLIWCLQKDTLNDKKMTNLLNKERCHKIRPIKTFIIEYKDKEIIFVLLTWPVLFEA